MYIASYVYAYNGLRQTTIWQLHHVPTEPSIRGAGQKDRSSGDENALCLINMYSKFQWKDFVIPIIFRAISRPSGRTTGDKERERKERKICSPLSATLKIAFFQEVTVMMTVRHQKS